MLTKVNEVSQQNKIESLGSVCRQLYILPQIPDQTEYRLTMLENTTYTRNYIQLFRVESC